MPLTLYFDEGNEVKIGEDILSIDRIHNPTSCEVTYTSPSLNRVMTLTQTRTEILGYNITVRVGTPQSAKGIRLNFEGPKHVPIQRLRGR